MVKRMCCYFAVVFSVQLNPDTFMPFWTLREHRGGNEEHIHCLSSGQEKHHSGLAFTCFSGKDDRAFSRSLTQNRKLFGSMTAFRTKKRSAKYNFTPRISWDLWREVFFLTRKTQISIFTSVQGVLVPAAYYKSYFPPNCASKSMFTIVSQCALSNIYLKKQIRLPYVLPVLFQSYRETCYFTNKHLLFYDFWTHLMRPTSQAVQLLDLINHLSFANNKDLSCCYAKLCLCAFLSFECLIRDCRGHFAAPKLLQLWPEGHPVTSARFLQFGVKCDQRWKGFW